MLMRINIRYRKLTHDERNEHRAMLLIGWPGMGLARTLSGRLLIGGFHYNEARGLTKMLAPFLKR